MATAFTSLLGLALPVQGELSGTWGNAVNTQITALLDTSVAGTTTLSTDADVTLTTTTGATNQARQAIILWNATGTVTRNITAPAQSKAYVVINASGGTQSIVLRGAGPTTGITIVQGEKCVAAWNGTDFVKISSSVATSLTGTAYGVVYASSTSALATGSALTFDGTNFGVGTSSPAGRLHARWDAGAGDGYTGKFIFNTSDQALFIKTYWQAGVGQYTTLEASNLANSSLTDLCLNGGTLQFLTGSTERARIDSSGNVGIGTTSPTSMLQTAGTSAKSAFKTPNIAEVNTISATAATGTINYDVTTQSVLYYTTNASGNFTVNFRGSSGTSLNTIMATGESLSATFLVTNGATAYYNSVVQVDGSTVTPKWQGGSAPTSGNASSIDAYTYVFLKTGSAAFTVLASVTKFA